MLYILQLRYIFTSADIRGQVWGFSLRPYEGQLSSYLISVCALPLDIPVFFCRLEALAKGLGEYTTHFEHSGPLKEPKGYVPATESLYIL